MTSARERRSFGLTICHGGRTLACRRWSSLTSWWCWQSSSLRMGRGLRKIFGMGCLSARFYPVLRFRTNPSIPGVECLAICQPDNSFLEGRYVALPRLACALLSRLRVAIGKRNLADSEFNFHVLRSCWFWTNFHVLRRCAAAFFRCLCERLEALCHLPCRCWCDQNAEHWWFSAAASVQGALYVSFPEPIFVVLIFCGQISMIIVRARTHMNPPQVDWVFVFHIPARIPWDLSMLQLGTTPMCKIKCLLPEAAQRWGFTLEWLDSFLSCTWWNFVGLDYFWAVTWSNFVAGISITSTLRRPPNCFNLLRQHEVLSRANVAAEATAASKLHVDVACLRWFWFDYGVFATGNFLVNCVRLYYNMYIPHIFTSTF